MTMTRSKHLAKILLEEIGVLLRKINILFININIRRAVMKNLFIIIACVLFVSSFALSQVDYLKLKYNPNIKVNREHKGMPSKYLDDNRNNHRLRIGEKEVLTQTYDGNHSTERQLETINNILIDDFLVNDDTTGGIVEQSSPSTAMDVNGNLVIVWEDYRNNNLDIYCQRYDSLGVAQGENFKVNDDVGQEWQASPSVSMDGRGNFVVVWQDGRNGNYDVYCQRYSKNGFAQGNNFKVNDDATREWQGYPSISMNESGNFVVAWLDNRNTWGNSDIFSQRFNSYGDTLGTNFKVNDDIVSSDQNSPSITINGNGSFVIVWVDERNGDDDIYCQRYTSGGIAQGINTKVNNDAGTSLQMHPTISMDGSGNFVIVWEDWRNEYLGDIYCQRYSSSGVTQGSNFKVNNDVGTAFQRYPSLSMDGSGNFVIVWIDGRNFNLDIYYQRYNSNGEARGTNLKVIDDERMIMAESPSVSMDGNGNFVVVWEDYRNNNEDIYCQQYNDAGTPLNNSFRVNDDVGTSHQAFPSITINGIGYFAVVWADDRNGNSDIYCQRYNPSGTMQDLNFKVNVDTVNAWQAYPSISMDESGNFVVVWEDGRNGNYDIYCQLYNHTGTPQGTNFRINNDAGTTRQESPSVAMDVNGNFVIVWEDYRNGNSDIYCQRYNAARIAEGLNFKINNDTVTAWQGSPSVSVDGNGNFVVAWEDYRSENRDIYCQRYNAFGSAQGTNFKVNDDVGTQDQWCPSISVDGNGNFVIVWHDERNGYNNIDIYCQRYNSSGTSQGVNFKVNDDAGTVIQMFPSLAIDGNGNFVVVWEDYRYGWSNPDIMGQRYYANGSLWGTNYRVVADGPNQGEEIPAVATNSNTMIFAWMDNRRSKGWDIYGKVVGWDWDGTTSVSLEKNIPTEFALMQNYPNPFNPSTTIRYELPRESFVTLKVYNVLGQEVATLVNEKKEAGRYEVAFDGSGLTSGVYVYRLQAKDFISSLKLLLLK